MYLAQWLCSLVVFGKLANAANAANAATRSHTEPTTQV